MSEQATSWRIRAAEERDVGAIADLVRKLAEYEREPRAAEASAEDFRLALFCAQPLVHAHVAEVASVPSSDADDATRWDVVGIVVWFVTFSTWKGRHGLWLEDLFVDPAYRRFGLGRALLGELASVCVERGWPRFEWLVLDWNEPAHGFYRSLGAVPLDGWTTWRLDGPALADLSASAAPGSGPSPG